jgi:hypothetical protein
MVVWPDEDLAFPSTLQKALLKSLLSDMMAMLLQVSIECRPRLWVVPAYGVLKEELHDHPLNASYG